MNAKIIQKLINKTTSLVSKVTEMDIADDLFNITESCITDEEKVGQVRELAEKLGGKNGRD